MAIINGRRIQVPPAGITGQDLIQQMNLELVDDQSFNKGWLSDLFSQATRINRRICMIDTASR